MGDDGMGPDELERHKRATYDRIDTLLGVANRLIEEARNNLRTVREQEGPG